MSLPMQNKICLVTGAGRGIGQAIARRLAEEGAIVYANERKNGAIAAWSAGLPAGVQARILPICFDLTDRAALKAAVMRIKAEQGHLDVLVNNAGIAYNERIGMIAFDHVLEMFNVNVFAALELIQLASRIMVRQGGGSIINIASMVGVLGDQGQAAYAASKGALIALTKSAAKELAAAQVRVNAIAPGLTDTDLYHQTDEKYLAERLARIGMKRLAVPDDIAKACVFLASDQSTYITGQVLGVDGSAII